MPGGRAALATIRYNLDTPRCDSPVPPQYQYERDDLRRFGSLLLLDRDMVWAGDDVAVVNTVSPKKYLPNIRLLP